jgi:hypothetical protein
VVSYKFSLETVKDLGEQADITSACFPTNFLPVTINGAGGLSSVFLESLANKLPSYRGDSGIRDAG